MNPNAITNAGTNTFRAYDYPANNTTFYTRNGLRFYKTTYCSRHLSPTTADGNFRMIIIRPDDNVVRPCILYTNGALDELNVSTYGLYPVLIDLALRGYTVVFYENNVSNSFTVGRYPSNIGSYPLYRLLSGDVNWFRKNSYYGFQQAVAANNFITRSGNPYNIDTNNIYTCGISAGALIGFYLNYARQNINFNKSEYFDFYNTGTNTYTNNHFQKISLFTTTSYNVNIKTTALTAISYASDAGDFFQTPGYKPVPALIFHGINDNEISLDGNAPLLSNGGKTLKSNLTTLGVRSQIVINCSGEHAFPTKTDVICGNNAYCPNFDVFTQSTISTKYYRQKYTLQQVSELNGYICGTFLNASTYGSSSSSIPYIQLPNQFFIPNTSPYVANSISNNGHFIPSSCNDAGVTANNPLRKANPETQVGKTYNESTLYPNPTSEIVNINIKLNMDINNYNIEIYNIEGKIIYNEQFSESIESGNLLNNSINIKNQSNGVYLLKISSETNILLSKTFVINK